MRMHVISSLTQKQKKYSTYAVLFLFAVGLRVITALAISWVSGVQLNNLALFYDGHLYILIAKTLPALYADIQVIFPGFSDNPAFITGWFPVYPFFIRLVSLLIGDLRLAALITAWFASGIAVVLFYELAKDYLEDPLFAAILFSFLPPAWLIDGSLALVESTYVCLLLACILAFQRGKTGWAAVWAALAVITQKSGFLLVPILAVTAKPRRRALLPVISALAATAALQAYLWWLFGDPFTNARVSRAVYGGENGWFGVPFAGFIRSLLDSGTMFRGMFWQRKFVIVLEAAFYVTALLGALIRYQPRMTVFTSWLGMVLLFYAALTGPWSFYAFPRFMSMASPAAIILACGVFRLGEKRWHWTAVGLLPLTILWTVLDALGALDLCYRVWTPDYFRALVDIIQQ
jgi:hypothetical protein